jgi:hypothetical protein
MASRWCAITTCHRPLWAEGLCRRHFNEAVEQGSRPDDPVEAERWDRLVSEYTTETQGGL